MAFLIFYLFVVVLSRIAKWVIVMTHVNHVKSICHLELTNPLTERIYL